MVSSESRSSLFAFACTQQPCGHSKARRSARDHMISSEAPVKLTEEAIADLECPAGRKDTLRLPGLAVRVSAKGDVPRSIYNRGKPPPRPDRAVGRHDARVRPRRGPQEEGRDLVGRNSA
jgi:hypothetical protein